MSKLYYFIILFSSLNIFSQKSSDSINYQEFKIQNSIYKDFAYINNNIYGLTKGDSLIIWDITKNTISEIIQEVSAIVLKHKDILYVKNNMIKSCNKSVGINYMDILKGKIYKLLFDKDDSPVVSTSKGIYYKGKYYVPNHDDGLYFMELSKKSEDSVVYYANQYFLDDEQNLWLGFDLGEYGGGLLIFNLETKKFTVQKNILDIYLSNNNISARKYMKLYDFEKKANKKKLLDKFPDIVKTTEVDTLYKFPYDLHISKVKGIAGGNGDYYVSESLFHFLLMGAKIVKVGKSQYKDFYKIQDLDEILDYKIVNNNKDINEYVGPVSYNNYNKSAYYYSNLGFFKIIENQNNKFSKELIIKPKALWTAGMPNAVGYAMNVTKFEFIDEVRFIFLTTNNGLGYYNGKDIMYYN